MRTLLPVVLAVAGCLPSPVALPLHLECEPDDTTHFPRPEAPPISPVGELAPFAIETDDPYGGPGWSLFGKRPEIVVLPDDLGFDVLLQDYGSGAHAKLVRIDRDKDAFVVTSIVDVDALERIMGLARDDQGYRYVASGVHEDEVRLDPEYPAVGEFREDVVHVDKLDRNGTVVWTVDLDVAREEAGANALVINPMDAGTSRLVWGGGRLALLHAINTDYDATVDSRHQRALTTVLEADSGAIVHTEASWVSHSFDQRLYYDGTDFLELHLGDAYPRLTLLTRSSPNARQHPVLYNKGYEGSNETFTRLGGVAPIPPEVDEEHGYLVAFVTESTPDVGGLGPKNVGISRIRRDFDSIDPSSGDHVDPSLPDELVSEIVTPSGAQEHTNRLQWLTDHAAGTEIEAERPHIVAIGCDRYVVLWEEWNPEPFDNQRFLGTWGVVIDAAGNVLVEKKLVTEHHVPRSDDVVAFDNTAAWISAEHDGTLYVNRVGPDLGFARFVIE
jgi:hypothetical protein